MKKIPSKSSKNKGDNMKYYIGLYTNEKMKVLIIENAPNVDKALDEVITAYPHGIITFIYKE